MVTCPVGGAHKAQEDIELRTHSHQLTLTVDLLQQPAYQPTHILRADVMLVDLTTERMHHKLLSNSIL